MNLERLLYLAGVHLKEAAAQAANDYGHNDDPSKMTQLRVGNADPSFKGRANGMPDRIVNKSGDNPMVDKAEADDKPQVLHDGEDLDRMERVPNPANVPGGAERPVRNVNRYGDNPLVDEEVDPFGDFTDGDLERLHRTLLNARVNDADIVKGDVQLSDRGYQKIARAFGHRDLDPEHAKEFFNGMLTALANKLGYAQSGEGQTELDEEPGDFDVNGSNRDQERFTYEEDFMGGVKVKDTETGKETYLKGDDASAVRDAIHKAGGDAAMVQNVLSQYADQMESPQMVHESPSDYFTFEAELDGKPVEVEALYVPGDENEEEEGYEPTIQVKEVTDKESGETIDLAPHQIKHLVDVGLQHYNNDN